MALRDYFKFVNWYFKYSTVKFFPKTGSRYHLSQRERLPILLLGYVLLLINVVVALFHLGQSGYMYFIIGILELCSMLYICRFSFLVYYILYARYIRREDSVNDRIIVEYIILGEYPKDLSRMIEKHYSIRCVENKRFTVNYYLVEKRNKRKNVSQKEFLVLRIAPNKVFFNKQEVFSEKITDMSILEDFLRGTLKESG